MELTFNELSLSTTSHSAQASALYDDFFGCCLILQQTYKENIELHFSEEPHTHIFHPDLSFFSWLKICSRDDQRSILLMLTKTPIVIDYPYYQTTELDGMGLGYAYENDLLLISFSSADKWRQDYLEVRKNWINDEDDLEEETLFLANLTDSNSAARHEKLIIDKVEKGRLMAIKNVSCGEELWLKRKSVFPSLIFCDHLDQSFKQLPGGTIFRNLVNRLQEFEKYFSTWDNGDFDVKAMSGDPRLESKTRVNLYKDKITFLCPDDETRLFQLHCDYGVYGMRMHFFPDTLFRKCFIGYFGKKIGA